MTPTPPPASHGPSLVPNPEPGSVSLVLPVFDEEEVLPLLLPRLRQLLDALPVPAEAILVDDGSRDRTGDLLAAAAREDPRLRVVQLARNFGHQAAMTAGLDLATGDAVVVMDADLQDPPEVVHEMLALYRLGYHVVYARRRSRAGEGLLKRGFASLFYRFMRWGIHPDLPEDVGDFRLMSRAVLDTVQAMPERERFLRGLVTWVGFPQAAVWFDRPARAAGRAKYTFWKSAALAWQAVTSFSSLPLRFSFYMGVAGLTFGLGFILYALHQHYAVGTVPGWTTIVVLQCLFSGAILLGLGWIGDYLAKVYEQLKGRPLYVVAGTWNVSPEARAAAQRGHIPASAPREAPP